MKAIIAATVTALALFAVQSPASAADYWHGGGHGASHAQHHWRGGGSYHAPQYSHGHAPRYSQYSSGYGNYGHGGGYRGYAGGYGGGYGGGYSSGYGHGAYSGRRGGGHHGHSALHVDIGPLHFGLGR